MKRFFSKFVLSLLALSFFTIDAIAQDPTTQASNLAITNRQATSMSLSWTRGNGSTCLVVVKPFSNPYSYPQDGYNNLYFANSNYGSGSNLGNSNYVVYRGTGTSVTVNSLSASTQYMAVVYEYNTQNILGNTYYYYLTTTGVANTEGAYTLCTEPATNASITSVTAINYTTANVNFSGGSGSFRLVLIDDLSNGTSTYTPQDGSAYTVSSVLTSAPNHWGSYSVYNSTGTSVSLSALSSARTYRAKVYSFCGSGTGATWNYKTTSVSSMDFTTLNYQPTLDPISNQTRCMNAGLATVNLAGISDGSTGESQTVTITATSSNQTLIPNANISVSYNGSATTGTLSYTPATNQSGTATITVTANDGFSSNNTIVRTFTVTVNPFPSAAGTISPSATTFCKNGTNIIFSVPTIANASSYVWTFPTGTTIVSGGTTNSVTVNFPPAMSATSGTITVKGVNGFGCGDGTISSKSVFFDKAPTVATAGPDVTICSGTTQLQGNQPVTGTGLWTVVSGSASFNNNTQYNTNVTGIANGQTVNLQWAISNGVCPVSTDQVLVTFDLSAPQCQIYADFFASNTNPCMSSTVNFTDNSVGATAWNWNFGPNATPTTSNVQNPSVVFNTAGPQTITLSITGPNGADNETKNNYINVIATPGAASAISGLNVVCAGDDQINYSINPIANAANYVWNMPSGATINSGNGTDAITVNFSTIATSGIISVFGTNACGNGTTSNLSVTVNPLPDNPSPITGDNDVCQGEGGVVYSINVLNNVTNYNWTLPSGASIVAGNNTNSITVDYNNLSSTGEVSVFGSNACGNSEMKDMTVNVNPLPGSADVITGQQLITNCPASNGIIYSVPVIANASNYDWILPSGANIVSGLNTATITVDFGYGSSSGNIVVQGNNACGNGVSNSLTIVVDPVETQNICLVTVNDSSNRNIVVWQKTGADIIGSYNIYRDIAGLGYTLIDNVHADSLSEYIDYSSGVDPNVTQYRYKVSVVDTCGNEGPQSSHHQTIFVYPPLVSGNDIILDWDDYEGAGSGFYYRIMRDTGSLGNWEAIDSVSAPTTVYNDLDGMNEGTNISYFIEIVAPSVCVATRATNHNTTRSNRTQPVAGNDIPELIIDQDNVLVYPNPALDKVTIKLNQSLYNQELVIEFTDINGRVVKSLNTYDNQSVVDVNELAKGIYLIRLTSNGSTVVKKLVIN